MRRSRKQLEEAIARAVSREDKAIAYYNLGLFYDNNGREAEAIPNYLSALELGLDSETRPRALAWLASSLYKTGSLDEGLERCQESLSVARDDKLRKFLAGLEKRITKAIHERPEADVLDSSLCEG